MSGNYIKLYAAAAPADSAYLLADGSVIFYISNADKYAITGKNLIVGSTEIIMERLTGTKSGRVETAVAEGGSTIKKIPADRLIAGMKTYSFGLNASMVLARQVHLTGQILRKNINDLEGEGKKIREFCTAYYAILVRLKEEYDKRRLPWLKGLIDEFGETLTCKKGEAYFKSAEPARITTVEALSDRDVEYQRGSVICQENMPGDEMYILKSGSVDVSAGGVHISTINESGTVIGESALLLGQSRNATLTAKNTVVMTRIRKEDLKDVAEKQDDFLTSIAMTLAKRHYFNISRIENVNRSLAEQAIDREISGTDDTQAIMSRRAFKDLNKLRDSVEEMVREKKVDFLNDLIERM
ncbi:MAG: cyclic nucleotide-binding domain-containing protein [Spirochaetes bacterium]|nr:cyclic nucleotide-binding domain-containing protein [Spirochaetota bacterium]